MSERLTDAVESILRPYYPRNAHELAQAIVAGRGGSNLAAFASALLVLGAEKARLARVVSRAIQSWESGADAVCYVCGEPAAAPACACKRCSASALAQVARVA